MDKQILRDVSRETISHLELFADLVKKWNPHINLVSKNTVPSIWERHILDSVQLFQFAPPSPSHWLDIGSGGGFPGIVMAVMAHEKSPNTKFTFIESDNRKATFLRTAARELGLPVRVLAERVEEAEVQNADVVTARALTQLTDLLGLVHRHMTANGTAILPKGKSFQDEIDAARSAWDFEVKAHQSFTEADARVLVVKEIHCE